MKTGLLTLLTITPFLINGTEIICSGQGSQGELVELDLNYSKEKKEMQIDGMLFPLQIDNKYAIAWSNSADDLDFVNILSRINGSLQVIVSDKEGNQSLRASLQCVEAEKALFR